MDTTAAEYRRAIGSLEPEIDALRVAVNAIAGLDEEARFRVLLYLCRRYATGLLRSIYRPHEPA